MLQSSHNSFSGDMMGKGVDNGIKTVESLRGRLLAEREASKAAKNEADLMTKRLGELERHLAIEIKSRNRAEKRLEYALKKLESLKRPNLPESSTSSSEGWKVDSRPAADSSKQCGASGDSANQVVSQEGSWSSVGTAHSWKKERPMLDEKINGRDQQELIADAVREHQHDADDTFALVPVVSIPHSSNTSNREINISNVQNVLLALRHIKEQLRNSRRELYGQRVNPENPISS